MATADLIIALDARVDNLTSELARVRRELRNLDSDVDDVDESLINMSRAGDIAGKALAKVGSIAIASAAAVIGMQKALIDYSKEIKIASELSGVAAEELQLMANATATVGIGIEQLGDISKDTREKIGDFLNTGGGGFQDFADAMKLTKKEAAETAKEFENLSGPEILQEMVKRMEEADVSTVQMSHALEGMANETTRLLPLLRDGSKQFNSLTQSARELTVPLTNEDIQKIADLEVAVKNAGASMTNLANQVLVDLSDMFIKAADNAAHFYASLNEGTIAAKSSRLADIKDEIEDLDSAFKLSQERAEKWWGFIFSNTKSEQDTITETNALIAERVKLQKEIADISGLAAPDADSADSTVKKGGGVVVPFTSADDTERQLEIIRDRFKSEESLLEEKYLKDREFVEKTIEDKIEENELLLNLELEYDESLRELRDNRLKDEQDRINDRVRAEEKAANKLSKESDKKKKKEDKVRNQTEKAERQLTDSLIAAGNTLFEDNKAVRAGMVIADTAVGISRQFADLPYPAALASSAAIAISGAVQLAAVTGATKGGGASPTTSASAINTQSQEPEQVTGEFEINETVTQGSNSSSVSNTITFTSDDADGFTNAIANALNEKIKSGEIVLG